MEHAAKRDRPMRRVVLALACLYAPYSWLVLLERGWDSYHWHWIRMWPILPGLLIRAIPAVHRLPDQLAYLAMAAATSLVFAPVVVLSLRSRRAAWCVSVAVAVLSGVNAWIAYQLYLA